jgi:hypothetical protein
MGKDKIVPIPHPGPKTKDHFHGDPHDVGHITGTSGKDTGKK